jgi:hypothetical protein
MWTYRLFSWMQPSKFYMVSTWDSLCSNFGKSRSFYYSWFFCEILCFPSQMLCVSLVIRWSRFFSNSPFLNFSRTSFLFPRVQRLNLIIALNLWPAKRTWISYWKSPFLMIRTYVRIILCKFQSDRKNRLGHSFATTKTNVRASDWNRWISRHVWCCNQRNGFVH